MGCFRVQYLHILCVLIRKCAVLNLRQCSIEIGKIFRSLEDWRRNNGFELSGCFIAIYVRLGIEQSPSWINCINFIGCFSYVKQDSLVDLIIFIFSVFLLRRFPLPHNNKVRCMGMPLYICQPSLILTHKWALIKCSWNRLSYVLNLRANQVQWTFLLGISKCMTIILKSRGAKMENHTQLLFKLFGKKRSG